MEIQNKNLKAHLFICTNTKAGKPSCGPLNPDQLVDELKSWIKENNLKDKLKVSRSGCLGHCQEGIAAVCYPQASWFTKLTMNDGESLKELLAKHLEE